MASKKKTILITGAAGLLGSHLTDYLLKKGYEVVGVDNLSGGFRENLPKNRKGRFTFYGSDVGNAEVLHRIFLSHKPVAVFHFAAYAAEGLSHYIRKFNYENNVVGSMPVINECIKGGAKLIFASSAAVYGETYSPACDQATGLSPIDPYGIAKMTVEMDIEIASMDSGLRYSIVRPHNVVGIRQNIWDRYRNVVGIFIRQAMQGKPITVFGDGTHTRAFSDIKFCVPAFEQLIDGHDGTAFNIGSDREVSIQRLANIVKDRASEDGIEVEVQNLPEREEASDVTCNHRTAEAALGFADDTKIADVISEMWAWAKDQPEREVATMPYELEAGMPEVWKS